MGARLAPRPEPAPPPRVVIYACTQRAYDMVFTPVRRTPGAEFVLISDRAPRLLRGWRWRPFPPQTAGLSPSMMNRYCKFFPHEIFPDADITVYVDGNILLRRSLAPLIAEFIASGAELGLFRHQARHDIISEYAFCVKVNRLAGALVGIGLDQLTHYFKLGLPQTHGHSENGVLFRRHVPGGRLPATMAVWWGEIKRFTPRDQLSLPYALHATGLVPHRFDWSYVLDNAYFLIYPHRGNLRSQIITTLYVWGHYGRSQRVACRVMMGLVGRTFDLVDRLKSGLLGRRTLS